MEDLLESFDFDLSYDTMRRLGGNPN